MGLIHWVGVLLTRLLRVELLTVIGVGVQHRKDLVIHLGFVYREADSVNFSVVTSYNQNPVAVNNGYARRFHSLGKLNTTNQFNQLEIINIKFTIVGSCYYDVVIQ